MPAPFRCSLFALMLGAVALAGCATAPSAADPEAVAEFKSNNDPLEPTNRAIYEINDGIDVVILRPLALAYRAVVPGVARQGVRNVLDNLASPVVLANDMMQGKPKRAGDTFMRLVINSTLGVAGLFDVATGLGYPQHSADFGMTLAVWGAGEGPFLMLPLFGPSNPRDAVGRAGDMALDPFTWLGKGATVDALGYARTGTNAVDSRSRFIDDLDKIKSQALDPYATLRSLYRQNRRATIEEVIADDRGTSRAVRPVVRPAR
jgi:phospholipid-binding lipoprotein MlaA